MHCTVFLNCNPWYTYILVHHGEQLRTPPLHSSPGCALNPEHPQTAYITSPGCCLTWVPREIWRAIGWARELLPTMPSTAWPLAGVKPCSSPWLK